MKLHQRKKIIISRCHKKGYEIYSYPKRLSRIALRDAQHLFCANAFYLSNNLCRFANVPWHIIKMQLRCIFVWREPWRVCLKQHALYWRLLCKPLVLSRIADVCRIRNPVACAQCISPASLCQYSCIISAIICTAIWYSGNNCFLPMLENSACKPMRFLSLQLL